MIVLIDYSDEAKSYCTFDPWNLKIKLIDENGRVISEEFFSPGALKKYGDLPKIWMLDTGRCNLRPNIFHFLARMKIWEKLDLVEE